MKYRLIVLFTLGFFIASLSLCIANAATEEADNQLFKAAESGDVDAAITAMKAGADVNARTGQGLCTADALNMFGETPLIIAARYGHAKMVKILIASGANIKDEWIEFTPLHVAAEKGHKEVVCLLLNAGADINATDGQGQTPLHVALRNSCTRIVQVLIKNDAKVDCRDHKQCTPLHYAASAGSKKAAMLLIQHRADVNAEQMNGDTPLHHAAWKGHKEIAYLLLDAGANVNAVDINLRATPLIIARVCHQEIAKLIIEWIKEHPKNLRGSLKDKDMDKETWHATFIDAIPTKK